ncbi:DUF2974 domain-containing protein [Fictibacillus nanhaiensis]|uniref:DUF2974 domain-containing protein n=1 Tax=Fictibacillus nanhaiensis TaxID=742169 RepID=A0ABS2ZMX4_9BACL|nr:DUF2974 domain-containing protein [Fictibacillus nanhaiensis]
MNKDWAEITGKGYYKSYKNKLSQYGNAIGVGRYRLYMAGSESKTGFYGAIFKDVYANKYIVAYAGTNDFRDVKSDLQLTTKIYSKGVAQKKYARIVASWVPANSQIVFTGHSLGGYLASVMSMETGKPSIVFNSPGFGPAYESKAKRSKNIQFITRHTFKKDPISQYGYQKGIKQYYYGSSVYRSPFEYGIPKFSMHTLKNFYTVSLNQK